MSRALLLYLSVHGTTRKIAESIAAGLRAAGYHPTIRSVLGDSVDDLDEFDLLGIGYPAHYYRAPHPVERLVKGIPQLDGLPAFVFLSYGTYPGDAGTVIRHELADRGAWEVGYFETRGRDLYLGYLKEGYLFSSDSPREDDLIRAHDFGMCVGGRAECGLGSEAREDPEPNLMYRIQKLSTHPVLREQLYSRLFRVDESRCTACGACVAACPAGNVELGGDGRPRWGRDCLFCLNCELRCPEDAIRSPTDWPIMRPFYRYGIRRAVANLAVEYERVRHTHGQLEPIS